MQVRIRSTAPTARETATQTTCFPGFREGEAPAEPLCHSMSNVSRGSAGASPSQIIDVVSKSSDIGPAATTRTLALCVVALVFAASATRCPADQLKELAEKAGIRILADGDSTDSSEDQARSAIPLNSMTPENRERAQLIIKERSQFRRLPSLQYTIDEPIYRYLLTHPDVAVSTWRVMGISRFEMWQTGPAEYEAQAIDGSEGIADILYQDDKQMVFVCAGSYHNPLLPRPMEASALIWFRAVCTPNVEGTHVVTQKADVFVRFPSSSVSAIAKVLTPVTNSLMDRNLFEVSLYGSMMSRAVRDEPEWVVQVAQQLEGVLPQRKTELIEVARKPRNVNRNGKLSRSTMPAADRAMIQSPQLLFLDPPKEEGAAAVANSELKVVGAGAVPASTAKIMTIATSDKPGASSKSGSLTAHPVSSSTPGNLMLIPYSGRASRRSPLATLENPVEEKPQTKRSDDGFLLQPVVVPPTGPTATGPVGSESSE